MVGAPSGDTRGLLARWPWQRRKRRCPSLLRPCQLSGHAVRPASLRPEPPARRRPGGRPVDDHDGPPATCTSPGLCLSRSRGWCRVGYSQRPTIKTNRMISDAVDMRQAADDRPDDVYNSSAERAARRNRVVDLGPARPPERRPRHAGLTPREDLTERRSGGGVPTRVRPSVG
jgi:hypothetical protein